MRFTAGKVLIFVVALALLGIQAPWQQWVNFANSDHALISNSKEQSEKQVDDLIQQGQICFLAVSRLSGFPAEPPQRNPLVHTNLSLSAKFDYRQHKTTKSSVSPFLQKTPLWLSKRTLLI